MDHRHGIIHPDQALAPIDVGEELYELFMPPQLRIIPLDFPRAHVVQRLHLNRVDDGRRYLLPSPKSPAHGEPHDLPRLILVSLVTQPDRGGLPAVAQLLCEDRRIKVECEHGSPPNLVFIPASASSTHDASPLRLRSPSLRRRGARPPFRGQL